MSGVNEKVLVTGATGFVGGHVLYLLLQRGYSVRVTARNQKKAAALTSQYVKHKIAFKLYITTQKRIFTNIHRYSHYKDKLEVLIVADMSNSSPFEGLLNGLTGVFHVASPANFDVKSNVDDIINPAINGTLSLLREAAKVPTIKRIVYTASIVCLINRATIFDPKSTHVWSEADQNPITFEEAAKGDAHVAYTGSKTLAERALWDFMKTNNVQFDVVSMCPTLIFGPSANRIESVAEFNESNKPFYGVVSGATAPAPFPIDWYVDVRDVALSHVLAFETPKASNQRYLINGGNYCWQEVADYARKYGGDKAKTQVGTPGVYPKPRLIADTSKSVKDLGMTYRSKEDTLHDTIAHMMALEAGHFKGTEWFS